MFLTAKGNLPWGVTATNFQWTLGGTFVNQIIPPANASSSCTYTNNPNLLKCAVLASNWWTSGDYTPITYEASVTCTLVFANGNPKQTITAKGKFSMHRPEVYDFNPASSPGASILNGDVQVLKTIPACAFGTFIDSAIDGEWGVTQLANGYSTNAIMGNNTTNTWMLDNAEFYPFYTNKLVTLVPVIAGANPVVNATHPVNAAAFVDSPGISCSGTTVIHKDFRIYLRFKSARPGSIFVTLGTVNWHIYAAVVPGTNGYQWSGQREGYLDGSITKSEQFPQWTNVLLNQNLAVVE